MLVHRLVALAIAVAMLGVAGPTPRPPGITVIINGQRLALKPGPRIVAGHLLVPVRDTIAALGLPFDARGKQVFTQIGARVVSLRNGSRIAQVGSRSIALDAPAEEFGGILFAPLRFFTQALGAAASFDGKNQTVTITAQIVGTTGDGIVVRNGETIASGTVSAVDLLSSPPTVTLLENGNARTYGIGANAGIMLQDIVANVRVTGELSQMHAGDFARVALGKDGIGRYVTDSYATHSGRIVAIADGTMVLNDGRLIVPTRYTSILLNAAPVAFGALAPGDQVTVRYNVQTGETLAILAGRLAPASAAVWTSGVQIRSIVSDATHPLRAGATFSVTMLGTPGGTASFDLGSFVPNLSMDEVSSGRYVGRYTIPNGASFAKVPIIGNLRVGAATASAQQGASFLSASSSPPGIAQVAPREGAQVNTRRPAIYATFVADAVPVNPSSILLRIDGRDVTASCTRSPHFITYFPRVDWPRGRNTVQVSVADEAGNLTSRSWSFTIR